MERIESVPENVCKGCETGNALPLYFPMGLENSFVYLLLFCNLTKVIVGFTQQWLGILVIEQDPKADVIIMGLFRLERSFKIIESNCYSALPSPP